jgi:N6-adenosine-specific RNA methylase IME4
LFELIYADPPWQLGNPDSAYAPEQYYPTLPLDEIAALPVPAADDALLYLWAVNSHLPDALYAMQAWAFEYRSCEVWVKPSIGMGVWTRNRHELLLIGRKGNASPAPRKRLLDSVIEAPRTRHSEKPTAVYERLERLYPHRSKLELFARAARPGWQAWGNQIEQAA